MPLLELKKKKKKETKNLSLSLLVTDFCGLDCCYCYEKKSERKKGQMHFNVAKEAITYYMEKDDGFENASIEFFGGEPLLAFPLIKEIVEWFFSRSWQKKTFFSIVTNGTILTQDMKEWLAKYSKEIVVAFTIDGCKEAHDLNRSDSYDLVYKNIPFFKKYWPYQATKFTVNDNTIPYIAESVIHLENMKLNFNGGVVLEDLWGNFRRKKKLLGMYEEQLAILVDFYEKRPDLYPPSPLFPVLPDDWGLDKNSTGSEIENKRLKTDPVRFCGAGHEMVTIDVDGTRYPCHRFLPLCTGKPAPAGPVNVQTSWKPDKCRRCKLISFCPTCAGFNYQVNGDTGIRTTFHCEAYKLGLLAACKLEALRLKQMQESQFNKLSKEEKNNHRHRINAVLEIIENVI